MKTTQRAKSAGMSVEVVPTGPEFLCLQLLSCKAAATDTMSSMTPDFQSVTTTSKSVVGGSVSCWFTVCGYAMERNAKKKENESGPVQDEKADVTAALPEA